jgi:hypothetical protein
VKITHRQAQKLKRSRLISPEHRFITTVSPQRSLALNSQILNRRNPEISLLKIIASQCPSRRARYAILYYTIHYKLVAYRYTGLSDCYTVVEPALINAEDVIAKLSSMRQRIFRMIGVKQVLKVRIANVTPVSITRKETTDVLS